MADDRYAHGHHESVLRSHRWRTAENSAPHLLPHLAAGQRLLDVGCGPGTITVDLARRVAPGEVVGVDRTEEVLAGAREAGADVGNVSFRVGDAYALPFDHASFDVVHLHQVLHHLTDPTAALREVRRVLRPGGVLSLRESDYAAFAFAPRLPELARWNEVFHAITAAHGSDVDAGRHLLRWAHAAGFDDATFGSSTWSFAGDDRAWWGGSWAERVLAPGYGDQALELGVATQDELQEISSAWRRWTDDPDATFVVVHGELIARR